MITVFFCFKQKTAYEMRISDWSSDVVLFRSAFGRPAFRLAWEPRSLIVTKKIGTEETRVKPRMVLLMRKRKEGKNRSECSAKKKASPEGPACEGLRRGCLKGRFLMRCNIILCKCEEVNNYCNKCNLHCTEAWPLWIGIASDYGAPRIGPAHDALQ